MMRVVIHWHGLHGEDVDAPSLGTFEVGLGGALCHLNQGKMSLPMAVGVN